jgi:hypothetical protein
MAQEQGTQKNNKEMNIQENSSATDSISGNENTGQSSWRPTDDEGELKTTEQSTGAAGQSPAQQTGDPGRTPGKAEGEDFEE